MPYPAPVIPETPSNSINHVLTKHFTAPPDNALKAVVAHFVCAQFNSILLAYKALKRGASNDSYQLWAVACALVSLTLALASFLVYKALRVPAVKHLDVLSRLGGLCLVVIMASTFLLYNTIRYGLGGLALLGIAMGVAGVVFYDQPDVDTSPTTVAAAKTAEQRLGYNSSYKPKTFLETEIDKTD